MGQRQHGGQQGQRPKCDCRRNIETTEEWNNGYGLSLARWAKWWLRRPARLVSLEAVTFAQSRIPLLVRVPYLTIR